MGDPICLVELREMARVGGKEKRFELTTTGVRLRVDVDQEGALTLRATYDAVAKQLPTATRHYRDAPARALEAPRPMDIALRPETADDIDVMGKAGGITGELQTGDDAFDARVFIHTASPEAVVKSALGPEVRAAVLELQRLGFDRITLDDALGDVTAVCSLPTPLWTTTGKEATTAFVALLEHLPLVRATGARPGRHPLAAWNVVLAITFGIAFLATWPAYATVASGALRVDCLGGDSTPPVCGPPMLKGIGLGLLVASVVAVGGARLARGFAGPSDSASTGTTFVCLVFLTTWTVAATVIAIALVR